MPTDGSQSEYKTALARFNQLSAPKCLGMLEIGPNPLFCSHSQTKVCDVGNYKCIFVQSQSKKCLKQDTKSCCRSCILRADIKNLRQDSNYFPYATISRLKNDESASFFASQGNITLSPKGPVIMTVLKIGVILTLLAY